jgi:Ca2+-transporting ATPase
MDEKWFQRTIEETLEKLGTRRSGLTESEAKARLLEYGSNELQRRKKPPAILAFLRQFLSPLIYVLLVAAGISLAVQHFIDAGVILGVLLVNAVIGYLQETRAEKAMEALLEMAAPKARVRREGKLQVVPAPDIVPGD